MAFSLFLCFLLYDVIVLSHQADFDAQRREERLRATYGGTLISASPIPSGRSGETNSLYSTEAKMANDKLDSSVSQQQKASDQPRANEVKHSHSSERRTSTTATSGADPLSDPLILNPFIAATENLLTWLEHLDDPIPSDSKPGVKMTRLDKTWSRVQEIASAERISSSGRKKSTQAAAMCCPTKNRRQDCVPYDTNRVMLEGTKNDYINASHIDFLKWFGDWCPRYIVAQAPMQKTVADFWQMILTQGCEVVVFLPPARISRPSSPTLAGLNDWSNTGEGGYGDLTNHLSIPPHLPSNKVGSRFSVPGSQPPLELRLQALKNSDHTKKATDLGCLSNGHGFTERILTVRNITTEQTRSLVHLTYHGLVLPPTGSRIGGITDPAIEPFCAFVNHVHTYYKQQRSLLRPIAVVCEHGAGLSGIFVTASVCLLHAERLGRLADCVEVAGRLLQQRRGIFSQPVELVTAARVVAHAAVEAAARRDVVVGPRRCSSSVSTRSADHYEKLASVATVPPVVAPVDSLFSDQHMQIGELLSVVDRFNLGGESSSVRQPDFISTEPVKDDTINTGATEVSDNNAILVNAFNPLMFLYFWRIF